MSKIYKIKVNGMKRKIKFLEPDNIIENGDIQFLNTSKQDILNKGSINNTELQLTKCVGEKASEHPMRIYMRILNF